MTLEEVLRAIDSMSDEEFEQVREHVEQRSRKVAWWIVPPENIEKIFEALSPMREDAANMSEEEVNAVIDEAIAEVRRERKARRDE